MKPIPVSEFSSHVERLHADRDKLFEMEYEVGAYSTVHVYMCMHVMFLNTFHLVNHDEVSFWGDSNIVHFSTSFMCYELTFILGKFSLKHSLCIHNKLEELLLLCKRAHLFVQSLSKQPQSSHAIADIPHNKQKNRFANIFPCKSIIIMTVRYTNHK